MQAQILIVEDERLVARDIAVTLQKEGYEVVGSCPSGESAIKKLSELSPDLVLLDIRIVGEIDGIEVAEYIQSFYDIPFIYLTAFSDPTTLARAGKTKPQGYVIKPFRREQLLSTISIALATKRSDVPDVYQATTGRFSKITRYVHEHLERDIHLEEMAKLMNMNPSYFCRAFQAEVGISPHQFLLLQRIDKAKVLLRQDRGASISEIAQECGFTNHSMLSKHFRRLVGVTPTQYRTSADSGG